MDGAGNGLRIQQLSGVAAIDRARERDGLGNAVDHGLKAEGTLCRPKSVLDVPHEDALRAGHGLKLEHSRVVADLGGALLETQLRDASRLTVLRDVKAKQHLSSQATKHLAHGYGTNAYVGGHSGARQGVRSVVVRTRAWVGSRLTQSDKERHAQRLLDALGNLVVGDLVEDVKRANQGVFGVEEHAAQVPARDAIRPARGIFAARECREELVQQLRLVARGLGPIEGAARRHKCRDVVGDGGPSGAAQLLQLPQRDASGGRSLLRQNAQALADEALRDAVVGPFDELGVFLGATFVEWAVFEFGEVGLALIDHVTAALLGVLEEAGDVVVLSEALEALVDDLVHAFALGLLAGGFNEQQNREQVTELVRPVVIRLVFGLHAGLRPQRAELPARPAGDVGEERGQAAAKDVRRIHGP